MSAKRKEHTSEPKAPAPVAEAAASPEVQASDEREPTGASPASEALVEPKATESPKAPAAAEQAKKRVFRVAPGRSITSPRGIRGPDMEVDPVRDNVADIDFLVSIGAVVES